MSQIIENELYLFSLNSRAKKALLRIRPAYVRVAEFYTRLDDKPWSGGCCNVEFEKGESKVENQKWKEYINELYNEMKKGIISYIEICFFRYWNGKIIVPDDAEIKMIDTSIKILNPYLNK